VVSIGHNLAWDLAEAADEHLSRHHRTSVYAKIGAGEFSSAIEELLSCFVTADSTVPASLAPRVARWVAGYVGCDNEVRLRALAHRSTGPRSYLLSATPAPPHT
jgi:hypothetical protein